MTIPNLDTMDDEGLKEFSIKADMIQHVYKLLRSYALAKRMAIYCRSKGDVERAFKSEQECEFIYKLLPAEYRW